MNSKLLSAVAIVATILAVLSASFAFQQEQATSRALSRARRAETAVSQATATEDRAAWERMERDAAILATDLNGSERKEVVLRFNHALHYLKTRYFTRNAID